MPLSVESLTEDSTLQETRDAISASIEQCVKEGKTQRECAGMSYDLARKNTGKELGEGRQE